MEKRYNKRRSSSYQGGGHGGSHGGGRHRDSRRDDSHRHSHGDTHGHGGGRGDSYRGRRDHRRRGTFDNGNQRERIAVESGNLVLIDQFMLANPEFVSAYSSIVDEPLGTKVAMIENYGGVVVEIDRGTYRVERDPYKFSIIIHPEGTLSQDESQQVNNLPNVVFVNTRCLAMVDLELLDDSSLLDKYQQLWFGGKDKACRDLLRDNGGAVRYGFSRFSDDLSVAIDKANSVVVLAPEVVAATAA